jgi:hypothetical protein
MAKEYDFSKFIIDADVPVPPPRHHNTRQLRLLMNVMKDGDSVELPAGLLNTYLSVSQDYPEQFCYRKLGPETFRIWRRQGQILR